MWPLFVNLEVMEKHLPDIGSDTDFVRRKKTTFMTDKQRLVQDTNVNSLCQSSFVKKSLNVFFTY